MRVLVVAPAHMTGGQAIEARTLCRGLAEDPRVEVAIQPIDMPLPRLVARVPGVRTAIRWPRYLLGLVRGLGRANVVHVFTAAFGPFVLFTTPAVLLARLFRTPIVVNYRDGRAGRHLRSGWVRWVLRRATLLVFPSAFLRDTFAGHRLHGEVVPNVVDPGVFRLRQRDPLRPILISCRLLEELYAVDNTVRAFAIVRRRHPEAQLLIVGGGDQEQQLKALVRAERIGGVEFCGAVPHERVAAFFDRADIFVNSSREDNMPHSILEAFSCGLPVVTTAAGGIPYVVEDGRNALCVEPDDPQDMAQAVHALLSDRSLARRLIEEGRRDCAERYRWPQARERWVALYRRVSAPRTGAREPAGARRTV